MKKIILGLFIIFSLFSFQVQAEGEKETGAQCSGNSILNNGSLCSPSFMINTNNLGLSGDNIKNGTAKDTIENGLAIIVKKLMIAFGILSLFIMTVGGGYMIAAGGKDELLNKGKSIFTAGLLSLLIALASAIIMKIIIYLLY